MLIQTIGDCRMNLQFYAIFSFFALPHNSAIWCRRIMSKFIFKMENMRKFARVSVSEGWVHFQNLKLLFESCEFSAYIEWKLKWKLSQKYFPDVSCVHFLTSRELNLTAVIKNYLQSKHKNGKNAERNEFAICIHESRAFKPIMIFDVALFKWNFSCWCGAQNEKLQIVWNINFDATVPISQPNSKMRKFTFQLKISFPFMSKLLVNGM